MATNLQHFKRQVDFNAASQNKKGELILLYYTRLASDNEKCESMTTKEIVGKIDSTGEVPPRQDNLTNYLKKQKGKIKVHKTTPMRFSYLPSAFEKYYPELQSGAEDPILPTKEIVPSAAFRIFRGNILRIVNQINGCYENGYHDACAVMIRRLLESIMIEAFEKQMLIHSIQDANGNMKTFAEIWDVLAKDPFPSKLGRNQKKVLNQHKNMTEAWHRAAHDRYTITRKQNIDDVKQHIQVLLDYLLPLAA